MIADPPAGPAFCPQQLDVYLQLFCVTGWGRPSLVYGPGLCLLTYIVSPQGQGLLQQPPHQNVNSESGAQDPPAPQIHLLGAPKLF